MLDHKDSWVPKNWCFWAVVLEKTFESPLGQQEDPTSPSWKKSVLNIHWKDWCWSWSSNTLAIWGEELTHWKRPWCWERLKAGGEGDNRERDDLMASPTQWTWVWVGSRSWWWTGKPGVLQSMGSQKQRWQSNSAELTEFFESILRRQLALSRSLRYYKTSVRLRINIIMVSKGFPDHSAWTAGDPSWIPR